VGVNEGVRGGRDDELGKMMGGVEELLKVVRNERIGKEIRLLLI
jgi:hypothetical protein